MKIYDCFQFFDEEMLLDLRLNIMNKYVDKFIITEATYMHNGKPKKLLFDISKFSKFKDKIIYIVVDIHPPDLIELKDSDIDKDDTIHKFDYPVIEYPLKVKSVNFDKQNEIEGRLWGIKGQYLIFDDGRVFNVRRHNGYLVSLET